MLERVGYIEEGREISTLSVVLDPFELGKCLDPVLPNKWGRLRDVTVDLREQRHESRCIVDITLRTTTGRYELIGKVYADDRSDVFRAMNQISQLGFGPEADFSIPQPVTYVPALCLLLQEKVEGPLAKEIFLQGNYQSRAMAAERCARWLARFHAIDFRAERAFNLSDQPVFWKKWEQKIAALGPRLADKAYQLLRQLESAASATDAPKRRAGHGSYSHRQIILAEGRTVTFDWDGYCIADPSRDIARFIIGLRRLALGRLRSIRALDAEAERFRQTYFALESRSTAQLPIYEAAICLELAVRNLRKGQEMKVEALIDEALRILEQEG